MTISPQGKPNQRYNINAVVHETGVNAATIRTWERRYGLPQPQRSAGRHRHYSQKDIDTLKWLLDRQAEGVSIRHAAESWHTLVAQGVDPLQDNYPAAIATEVAPPALAANPQLDELRQRWIDACLAFKREAAEGLLTEAFARFSPELVCTDLLQKAMGQIGQGWYVGAITIQQEHFASALAVRRLEGLVAATPQPVYAQRILVCCAPEEHHLFSTLLLTYLLLRKGWDVYYLGANVPATAMKQTISQIKPHLVILAAQRLYTAATLLDMAQLLGNEQLIVGYGGIVFNQMPALQQKIPGYFLGRTLQEGLENVAQLLTVGPPEADLPRPVDTINPLAKPLAQYLARRTLIESHVWGSFVAEGEPTEDLTVVNRIIAEAVIAALKLGDIKFAGADFAYIEHLLISQRPTHQWLQRYVRTYHQATKIHLSDSATLIVDWLAQIVASAPNA